MERIMETHPSPPQPTSPNSTSSSSTSSSCSSSSNNNNNNNATTPFASNTPTTPISAAAPAVILPRLPNSNSKSVDSNPYPTTFIQADTASFKQVVQMLTGAAAGKHAAAPSPPRNTVLPPKRPPFKLYERRNGLRNLKTICPLAPASSAFSPRRRHHHHQQQPEIILSPSVLDFPALALSPVTPLNPDPFNRSPQPNSAAEVAAAAAADEERAIAEKGFYLHPSPRSPRPPRLLPLFPLTSPTACAASAAAATATPSFP